MDNLIKIILILFLIYIIYLNYKLKKKEKEFNNFLIKCKTQEYESYDKDRILKKNEYYKYFSTYKVFKHNYENGDLTTLTYKKKNGNKKALIWAHGLNDYYHHFDIGEKLLDKGFDIYAITFRKYLTTTENTKYYFYISDLQEYIDDLNNLFPKILEGKYNKILLYGHSTGGLTSTIYCHSGKFKEKIDALILNSPFFDIYLNNKSEFIFKKLIYYLGNKFPKIRLRKTKKFYKTAFHEDIHKRFYFKNKIIGDSNLFTGSFTGTYKYQKKIQNGEIKINIPILVLLSDKSSKKSYSNSDTVLDTKDILKYSKKDNIKIVQIKDAIHDVFLSKIKPRTEAINLFLNWINKV